MQCIFNTLLVGVSIYIQALWRYSYLILETYHPDSVFTWARMWGPVVIFWSPKGSASKIFGNTDLCATRSFN